MSSKTPHTTSNADLLALIEDDTQDQSKTESKPSEDHKRHDLLDFLSVYNIQSGSDRVFVKKIYELYKKWSLNPIGFSSFSTKIQFLFESVRYGKGAVILINQTAIKIESELWKLIKPIDKTKYKGWKNHFDNYLKYYGIKKGGLFIKDVVLYNIYDKWTYKNHKKHPLSFKQFCNFCKLYFKSKRNQGNYWFGVDNGIIQHLTEVLINENKRKGKNK